MKTTPAKMKYDIIESVHIIYVYTCVYIYIVYTFIDIYIYICDDPRLLGESKLHQRNVERSPCSTYFRANSRFLGFNQTEQKCWELPNFRKKVPKGSQFGTSLFQFREFHHAFAWSSWLLISQSAYASPTGLRWSIGLSRNIVEEGGTKPNMDLKTADAVYPKLSYHVVYQYSEEKKAHAGNPNHKYSDSMYVYLI